MVEPMGMNLDLYGCSVSSELALDDSHCSQGLVGYVPLQSRSGGIKFCSVYSISEFMD